MKAYSNPAIDFLFTEAEDVIATSGMVSLGGDYDNDNNMGIGYDNLF